MISITRISLGHAISAIRGRFLMIFALDMLNVCHISTSALVDLKRWWSVRSKND